MLKEDFKIIEDVLNKEIAGNFDGWKRYKDKPESKIYYQLEPGQRIVTLYIEKVFDAPIINLCAFLAEVQLFKNWVPLVKHSELVGEVSHLRKLAHFIANLPWPFNKREVFIRACGLILKEENAAVLSMCSIKESEWLGVPVVHNPSLVALDVHRAFIYAQVVEGDKTLVKMVIHGDPHIDYIPQWMINFCLKSVISVFVRYLEKKAKKLPEEYVKLVESKPEFY